MDTFESLMDAAGALLRESRTDPHSRQVLAVQTQSGAVSAFENDLSADAEDRFLSAQKEPLSALLCLWANGKPDVPSIRIREGLLQADPKNAEAALYLQGEEGIVKRPLAETVAPRRLGLIKEAPPDREKEKRIISKKELLDWADNLRQTTREAAAGAASFVKEKRDAVSERSIEKRLENERKALKPVFLEDLAAAGFRFPPMICIEDPDEKHMKSVVCKGSIGFQSREDDLQILHLYPESLDQTGVSFFPRKEKAAYFADNSSSNFYVNLEEYFEFQKKARIDELEQIAFCLGAIHVEARLIEQERSQSEEKKKVGIKAPKSNKAGVESGMETREAFKAEVALSTDFAGNNAPWRPVLRYFNNEASILSLIDMRLNGENTIKSKTYSWDFSRSSGIQKRTAANIENALKKMKYGMNLSLVEKASEEKRTMLKYTIRFKAEKPETEQENP